MFFRNESTIGMKICKNTSHSVSYPLWYFEVWRSFFHIVSAIDSYPQDYTQYLGYSLTQLLEFCQ